ncbi:glycosyltransferase family 39 protein [Mucilaginibacter sp. HMF5004]|uniref:glycosyltransferase family 39 protein n=1 Tax=Mucilaginibacter rivuli TaxID=2857527 RepID=UPI001C5EF70D|nr:glycosyltransferase family 39 protein [Mucilaginibacter rivuli]MBW4891777.1 glycosyltransferase family 39 protein [Mucilaginibacter rivuli]
MVQHNTVSGYQYLTSAKNRPFLLVFILALIINIAGIATTFFTNDPALYSLIAKAMVQNHNYIDLMYRGKDWLDKPHFPFWMVALSFNIFGANTIAYKLPALIFYFVSVRYTYLLAKKFYGVETGLIAALILLTAQHAIMSNTDVRAEPYIMGLLMGGVYHFANLKERFNIWQLLVASIFTACAVMTKGIYLLIPIGFAIIGDYVFKRDFKGLLQWRWLMAVVLVALFILPEIYTLYVQFDLHPEKVVFGHTNVSGIKWFLWDSQFGRFNNTGYIARPDHDYFFFLHTLLWAFAPWTFLLYAGIFLNVRKIFKGIEQPEYMVLSGALPMLIIFSVSQFQLPFYTNILFPFFAMITATFVAKVLAANKNRYFTIAQYVVMALLIIVVTVLAFIIYRPFGMLSLMPLYGCFTGWFLGAFYKYRGAKWLMLLTCYVSIFVNFYLLTDVYRILLYYRGEVTAPQYINSNIPANKRVIACFEVPDSFEFYTKRPVEFKQLDSVMAEHTSNKVVLIGDTLLKHLQKERISFSMIKAFENYPNEVITPQFLKQSERYKTLDHYYLIEIDNPYRNR